MVIKWCSLPIIECPHCEVESQIDDYYDMESGEEIECPKCEKIIYVTQVDTILEARLSSDKEG